MLIVSVRKTLSKQNKTLQTLEKNLHPNKSNRHAKQYTPGTAGNGIKGKTKQQQKDFEGAIREADFFAQKNL